MAMNSSLGGGGGVGEGGGLLRLDYKLKLLYPIWE